MGWGYRKRVTLIPGVKINFSKSGISTTIGVKGASVNFGSKGTYVNAGIPGSGLYSRTRISSSSSRVNSASANEITIIPNETLSPEQLGEIKSSTNSELTSDNLQIVKDTLLASQAEWVRLSTDKSEGEKAFKKAKTKLIFFKILPPLKQILKKTYSELQKLLIEYHNSIEEINQSLQECKVQIEVNIDDELKPVYQDLVNSFTKLSKSEYCWDITGSLEGKMKVPISSQETITRRITTLKQENAYFISSQYSGLYFKNVNGSDLIIYPTFLLLLQSIRDFALIELSELLIEYLPIKYKEMAQVPNDSKVVDKTWTYCNKNGTPNMRRKNNYEIPVAEYGRFTLRTQSGLNESFMFSNNQNAKEFVDSFLRYMDVIKSNRQ